MRPLSVVLALAFAVPALAQPPGPRVEAELDKLRAQVKELEAKLRQGKEPDRKPDVRKDEPKKDEADKKPEPRKGDGDKKPDVKKEEPRKGEPDKKPDAPRGPMGGFGGGWGFGNGFSGGFNPMGGPGGMGERGPGTPPGFDKLTADEQKTFRGLTEKMARGNQPDRKPDQPKSGGNLEQRMERLERMIEEIRGQMNRGPGGPGRGGEGGPGGPGGFGGGRGPGR